MRNKSAFTLFEILIVCMLLCCLSFFLLRTPQRLNNQFLRVAATQLTLFLTQQCELARTQKAAHTITLPPLPAQVILGAPHGALGPPSKQTTPIKKAITCTHTHDDAGYHMTVTPAGTLPPGTIYLTNNVRDEGYALSSTGNGSSPVRCYRWTGSRWAVC